MPSDSNFLVKIYDNNALEYLYDKEGLCDIYGEYFTVHDFRHTDNIIYCIISAYKATTQDIKDVLTEHLCLDPENIKIKQIDINSLFNF